MLGFSVCLILLDNSQFVLGVKYSGVVIILQFTYNNNIIIIVTNIAILGFMYF